LAARRQGDWSGARSLFAESLTIYQKRDLKRCIVECLEGLAEVASHQQQLQRAARLFGAAAELRKVGGWPLQTVYRVDYEHHEATTRTALGAEAFAAACTEGRGMSLDEAVAFALQEQPDA
jgi:hypothetical protein